MGSMPVGSSGCLGAFPFYPLIVEQFCDIDKLQVWYSEGGKGQLRVNGSALGYEAHLDAFVRQSYIVFMG